MARAASVEQALVVEQHEPGLSLSLYIYIHMALRLEKELIESYEGRCNRVCRALGLVLSDLWFTWTLRFISVSVALCITGQVTKATHLKVPQGLGRVFQG